MEVQMSCRTALLGAVAVAFTLASLPADAAMPVTGPAHAGPGSDIVLAQGDPAAAPKAKKRSAKKSEVDQSVDSGTVPKRYRSSVPKQYHHLIPFAK
jgi:hypothetical protein